MTRMSIYRSTLGALALAVLLCVPAFGQLDSANTPGFKNGQLTVGRDADSLYKLPPVASPDVGKAMLSAGLNGEMTWGTVTASGSDTSLIKTMKVNLADSTVDAKFKYLGSWAKAGEALSFGNLVYLDSDSTWKKSDADTVGTEYSKPAWGFVVADIGNGSTGVIMRKGMAYASGWSWTPGARLYVDTVAGAITEDPDTSAGHVLQIVGFALHPKLIEFSPDPTWARK